MPIKRKTSFLKIMALFIGLTLILLTVSACAMTKTKYETAVKSVLDNLGKELKKKGKDKQIAALDLARAELEEITPPDDFFSGHSDLVETVDLLSEAIGASDTAEKVKKDGTPTNTKFFELMRAAQNDFAKAMRELPFLEYELRDALGGLFQQAQSPPPGSPPGFPPGLQR